MPCTFLRKLVTLYKVVTSYCRNGEILWLDICVGQSLIVFIFAGALFLFGRNMETDMEEKGVTEAVTDETYPYLQLQTQGQTVNVLYGYSAPLEANVVRESITPINQNRQISLLISKAKSRLVNVTYSIVDKESGEVYETGSDECDWTESAQGRFDV